MDNEGLYCAHQCKSHVQIQNLLPEEKSHAVLLSANRIPRFKIPCRGESHVKQRNPLPKGFARHTILTYAVNLIGKVAVTGQSLRMSAYSRQFNSRSYMLCFLINSPVEGNRALSKEIPCRGELRVKQRNPMPRGNTRLAKKTLPRGIAH